VVLAYETALSVLFAQGGGQRIGDFPMGAAHGADCLTCSTVGTARPPTAERQVLAQRLIAYWSQFARTGNPKQ
jgi:para-nitrobenzyl esterase